MAPVSGTVFYNGKPLANAYVGFVPEEAGVRAAYGTTDENGKPIGCDIMTALLAEDFLKQPANKGATIVYDLRSSHVVPDTIKRFGGVPKRDRVGHAFIIGSHRYCAGVSAGGCDSALISGATGLIFTVVRICSR